jgi:two-component system LytT family sensor kinase
MGMWSKLPLFWRFQLLGWGVFVIVTFPLKFVLTGSMAGALILCLVRDGSSFLLTLGMRWIYRAFWSKGGLRMAALIVLSCSIGGLLQYAFLFLIRPVITSESEFHLTRSLALSAFYERTGLLFAWSFLYFGIRHAIDGIQNELRLALIESEKRQAQLQMLRFQMNPHFLFNALNAIQSEVGQFSISLKKCVKALAGYLRFSLDHSADEFLPLGAEYDAVTRRDNRGESGVYTFEIISGFGERSTRGM